MRATLLVLTMTALASAAHAESWRLTELPPPPAGWSVSPRGINDRGQIAADRHDHETFTSEAVFFDGASWSALPSLGGASTRASGLNRRGDVVGTAETEASRCEVGDGWEYCVPVSHAVVWRDGVIEDLGTGEEMSFGYGINDGDHVVGRGESFAQQWVRSTDPEVFGTFGGTCQFSDAFAVNARGQVVGSASTSAGSRAFLWDARTGLVELGTLGGPQSVATGISDAGHVVGYADTAEKRSCNVWDGVEYCEYYMHAFLWKDGVMTDLGTLGGSASHARDVNSRGEVVGTSETADKRCFRFGTFEYCQHAQKAFVWSDGRMIDLGDAGFRFSFAEAINERGDIVGSADREDRSGRPVVWRRE